MGRTVTLIVDGPEAWDAQRRLDHGPASDVAVLDDAAKYLRSDVYIDYCLFRRPGKHLETICSKTLRYVCPSWDQEGHFMLNAVPSCVLEKCINFDLHTYTEVEFFEALGFANIIILGAEDASHHSG